MSSARTWLVIFFMALPTCDQDRAKLVEIEASSLQLGSELVYRDEGNAWEATLADFDRDGNTDILINGHRPRMFIRYFRSGSYEPSAFVFKPSKDRHACDAADVDGDGLLDLYCTQGAMRGTGEIPNELWFGVDGIRFRRALSHGAESAAGRGRFTRFFNYNGDGRPDLYVSNYVVWDGGPEQVANQVFVNTGGSFEIQPDSPIAGNLGVGCLDVADFNADGIDDLVICSYDGAKPANVYASHGPGAYTALRIQESDNWMDAKFADLNGDGRIDLLASTLSDRVVVFFNDGGNHPFTKALEIDVSTADPQTAPVYTQVAAADIDHDGAQDLYVARRLGLFDHLPKSDLKDVLLLGPDWRSFVIPPTPASGLTNMVYGMGDRFLVINAGRDSQGSVEIIRAVTKP